jgi:uncharacterized membrane protein
MNKDELIKRFKNPLFLVALAGLIYQVLQGFGVKIDQLQFKSVVDLISYVLIGSGIYSSFGNANIDTKEVQK